MNIHKTKTWFTLVELIVVITILAILATLSFVSFTWYLSSTRDSKRAVDINNINKSFEIAKITSGKIVFPDKNIDITLSGALVWNQWDIKDQTLSFIWVSDEAFDPLDSKPYQFFSNAQKTKFQIVSFFENIENSQLAYVSSAFADSDYRNRYPFYKGDWLGFILNENNEPIHWENAIQTAGSYELAVGIEANKKIKPVFSNAYQNTYTSLLISGQINLSANSQWILNPESCPEHFIHVPGNSDLWQAPFCIWKYEASNETSDLKSTFKTLSWKAPAVKISDISQELKWCKENGNGYHMMTLNEWLTIARNIENESKNWSTGVVWNWFIKSWNSWDIITWFSWGMLLNWWPSWNITNDDKRQLTLSNGEVIWDFVWNAWELVTPLSWTHLWTDNYNELYLTRIEHAATWVHNNLANYTFWTDIWVKTLWKNILSSNIISSFGPKVSPIQSEWLWSIFEVNSTNATRIVVGWDYSSILANENGLFSLAKLPWTNYPNVTTRCAYTGN